MSDQDQTTETQHSAEESTQDQVSEPENHAQIDSTEKEAEPFYNNAFDAAEASTDIQAEDLENNNKEEAAFTIVDLKRCEFKEATTPEAATDQLGRLKAYTKELKSEIEHHRNNNTIPDKYEVVLDESLTKQNITMSETDPMFKAFREMAPELGLNQNQFNKLVNFYTDAQLKSFSQFKDRHQASIDNVLTTLGKNDKAAGEMQLRTVMSQLTELGVSKPQLESIKNNIINSGDIEAVQGVQHILQSVGYKQMQARPEPPIDLRQEYEQIKIDSASAQYKNDKAFKAQVNKRIENLAKNKIKYNIAYD